MNDGARRAKACELLGISVRTLYRWNAGTELADQRRGPKGTPQNALSDQEKGLITTVANSPAFRDLSAAQIVPILADSGVYLASEATFYRVLREGKLLAHRGRSRPRRHCRRRDRIRYGCGTSPTCGVRSEGGSTICIW